MFLRSFLFDDGLWRVDPVQSDDAVRQGDNFIRLAGAWESGALPPRANRPNAYVELGCGYVFADGADVFRKVHTHGLCACTYDLSSTECAHIARKYEQVQFVLPTKSCAP